MLILLRWADAFRIFLVETLVPFFTEVPHGIDTYYLSFSLDKGLHLKVFTIPWFFGNYSFGELILIYGLIAFLGVRLVKFLLDALPVI